MMGTVMIAKAAITDLLGVFTFTLGTLGTHVGSLLSCAI